LPGGTILPTGTQLFYTSAPGLTSATSLTTAEAYAPIDWSGDAPEDIYYNVAPSWTEDAIATPRQNEVYSDGVTATGTPDITYTVSAGALPDGLDLAGSTGAITGTPVNAGVYDFTVTATSDYGHVDKEFTGTLLAPHLAPSWVENGLSFGQQDVAYSDSVTASGDPTITYSVSSGSLPPGLHLDSATGALTGTPTATGAFAYSLTATNDYGHIDQTYFTPILAAPDLGLTLDFAKGTSIDAATTTIEASGLKVDSTYTLTLHSDPVVLATATVDESGGFHSTITIPADTPVGAHELILSGVAPDGRILTAHAWFTLLTDGTIGAISYSGPLTITVADAAKLAATGIAISMPLELAVGTLTLGTLLLLRRRKHSQRA
jgi:hypothetical protein